MQGYEGDEELLGYLTGAAREAAARSVNEAEHGGCGGCLNCHLEFANPDKPEL